MILEVEIPDKDWNIIRQIAGIPEKHSGERLDLGWIDYPINGWKLAGSLKRAYRKVSENGTGLPGF